MIIETSIHTFDAVKVNPKIDIITMYNDAMQCTMMYNDYNSQRWKIQINWDPHGI